MTATISCLSSRGSFWLRGRLGVEAGGREARLGSIGSQLVEGRAGDRVGVGTHPPPPPLSGAVPRVTVVVNSC